MFIEGQTHFWIIKRTWNEFTLNKPHKKGYSLLKSTHYLRACPTKSGKKFLILYAKQPMEIHRGPTPSEKCRFELKDNSKHSICLAYPLFFYLHFTRSPSMARVLIFVQCGSFCSLWRGSGHRALDGRSVCILSFPRVRMVTWIPRFGRNWRTWLKRRRRGWHM